MRSFGPVLVLFVFGRISAETDKETIWKGLSVSCINGDGGHDVDNSSLSCHGIRLVRKIMQKLLEEARKKKSVELFNGISLIEKEDLDQPSRDGRHLKDYGPIVSIVKWLDGRELQIKLSNLLPVNFRSAIEQSLPSADEGRGKGGGGGFGGNNGMLMAMMMGKMMAAMGMGALGLLAMKALMLSGAALMMSLLAAAKKMSDGKGEESHHVVYAQEVKHGHYRRRRSLEEDKNDPYRGYTILPTGSAKII